MKRFIPLLFILVASCGKSSPAPRGVSTNEVTSLLGMNKLPGKHRLLDAAYLATQIINKKKRRFKEVKKLDKHLDIFCIENICTIKKKDK